MEDKNINIVKGIVRFQLGPRISENILPSTSDMIVGPSGFAISSVTYHVSPMHTVHIRNTDHASANGDNWYPGLWDDLDTVINHIVTKLLRTSFAVAEES